MFENITEDEYNTLKDKDKEYRIKIRDLLEEEFYSKKDKEKLMQVRNKIKELKREWSITKLKINIYEKERGMIK